MRLSSQINTVCFGFKKSFCLTAMALLLGWNFSVVHAQSPATEIDSLLSRELQPNEPGCVVLVAKANQILFRKAYGMANVELNVPMSDSAVCYIGSNTKQFTAVAILQLVEQKKLSLSDSLGKYLSCTYPVSSIRIQQLLSHTSGLGSNTETPAYKAIEHSDLTPEQLVRYYLDLPLDFSPGGRWQYNNANFYVLGYLLQKLSGLPYADYLDKNIFRPAGMLHSFVGRQAAIVKNRVPGYTNFRQGVQNTHITNFTTLYSSGGIQSTVDDMYRWNRALVSGKLLRRETLRLAQTPQLLTNGSYTNYGFGWYLETLQGSPTIRHGGLVEGFTSETLFLPKEDVFVVMLLNQEGRVPVVPLARMAAAIAINKPFRFAETPVGPKSLKAYVGLYRNNEDDYLNISEDSSKLFFQRFGGKRYEIKHAEGDAFFFDFNYLCAEFERDASNRITQLVFSQVGIAPIVWKKTSGPALPSLYPERMPDSLLNQYAGVYLSWVNDTIHIERKTESLGLVMLRNGKTKQALAPLSLAAFVTVDKKATVEFHALNSKIDALWLTEGKQKKAAKKISQ